MSKPVVVFKKFPVKVAVWKNDGKEGRPFFSANASKCFKNKQTGKWEDTPYLTEDDMLVAAELLKAAWHQCCAKYGEEEGTAQTKPTPESKEEPAPF